MTTQWHLMMILTLQHSTEETSNDLFQPFISDQNKKLPKNQESLASKMKQIRLKFTWVATVSVLLRSPPLLERLSSDDSIALAVEAVLPR